MAERGVVVIPTYNERENLPRIVPMALAQDPRFDVLVVDDGSPDGTGAIADGLAAADPRVHVLHRTTKEGLGRAYLAGFAWALEREYAWVFEMDADFSHDPKFLTVLLEALPGNDVVLGSRYVGGVNVINWPMSRLLLSWFANKYVRWFTALPLTDATGGFKCFRREVLAAIPFDRIKSNGYAFQIEMSYRAWRKNFKLKEVPIVFVERAVGTSKMNKRIVREAIWMVPWLRLQAILGRLR